MPHKILFLEGNLDGTVGGSYYLMYDLVVGIDRARFLPIVGFHRDNFLIQKLRDRGVDVQLFPSVSTFEFQSSVLNVALAPVKKLVNFYRQVIGAAKAQAAYLRTEKIDLVNLNNSITGNHSWMVAAKLAGIPCITHEMGINLRYSGVSRYLGRRLQAIICLSNAIYDAMERGGARFANTVVIHCGIDLKRYVVVESPKELRAKHHIPPDSQVIGIVGNIREWKGQETLVRAMRPLLELHPQLYCVLVGATGERDLGYRQRLEAICAELRVQDRIIFAGFQYNSIDYMNLMDVVVHTSIHPEPFGIVTLEAMSLSKPLISTTIGGPAEVVVHGETGLLVEPGQPELLATAIDQLLKNPEIAAEMGRKGLLRLRENFRLETNIARTMMVYESILCGKEVPNTCKVPYSQTLR